MPCTPVDLGNGVRAIVCTRGRRRAPCQVPGCTEPHTALCDWRIDRRGRAATCDLRLCAAHRWPIPGELDRDLCPAHRELHEAGPQRFNDMHGTEEGFGSYLALEPEELIDRAPPPGVWAIWHGHAAAALWALAERQGVPAGPELLAELPARPQGFPGPLQAQAQRFLLQLKGRRWVVREDRNGAFLSVFLVGLP